jgi:hypothetical protein
MRTNPTKAGNGTEVTVGDGGKHKKKQITGYLFINCQH